MNDRCSRHPWLLPTAVAAAMFVLYATTLTQVHTFDALSYILDVSRKPWQQLFHPHHVAYGLLGAGLKWLAGALGRSDIATTLQLANAIAGSLGLGVFAAVVQRQWQRAELTVLAALGCGVSYAFWYYAVEVEVYTIAAFWSILVLWFALEPLPERTHWRAGLAVSLAGAVLFHQTNALLALPLLVRAWPALRRGGRERAGWLWAGGSAVALVVATYAWVMIGVSGFRDWATARHWLFEYVESGWWGGRATIGDFAKGISDTVADKTGGIVLVGFVVLVLSAAIQYRSRMTQWWLVVWVLSAGVFFGWWEPDNIEFWIGITPVAVLLCVTPMARLPRADARLWVAAGLLVYTGWTNATAIRLRGDAATDVQRRIAHAVRDASAPADLLLVPDGLQELYLPYYEGREHYLSVNGAIAANGDWERGCAAIRQGIADTHRAGAQVIVAADFLTPSVPMQRRYGLGATAVRDCLGSIAPLLTPLPMPADLPAQYLLPRAGVRLQQHGYVLFTGQPLGWSILNAVTMPSVTGWWLEVTRDPVLMSPILGIPMPKSLDITLTASGTADRTIQVFVATQPGIFDEQHAVTQAYDAGQQTVHIDLTQLTPPPTTLIQLRIDPVADGAGGTVNITGMTVTY